MPRSKASLLLANFNKPEPDLRSRKINVDGETLLKLRYPSLFSGGGPRDLVRVVRDLARDEMSRIDRRQRPHFGAWLERAEKSASTSR